MRARLLAGTVLLVLGCPAPSEDEGGEEAADAETDETTDAETTDAETTDAETTDETTDAETTETGGECLPAQDGVARTFGVDLLGFPEIQDDLPTNSEGIDFEGPCLLDGMDFDGETLTMALSCEHPAPSLPEGASVVITTAATGIPAGVTVGDTLTFDVVAYESQGGDVVDPDIGSLVMGVNVEFYQLRDDDGPIFAANARGLEGNFQEVMVDDTHDCPTWAGCSDSGTISGYIRATAGGQSIDVQIGEVGVLDNGSLSWDVSLFQARFDAGDCHFGITGSFSLVRRS